MPVRLPVDERLLSAHPDVRSLVRAAVSSGEVIAYPTETFYGLGVDPRNAAAVTRIFTLKGRAPGEALPLIAGDAADVERVCGALSPLASRLAERFWPGPLTLVVPVPTGAFPDVLLGTAASASRPTIAVRVPGLAAARMLATLAGGLLTSTSANRSGAPPAASAAAVFDTLGDDVAIVVDGGMTMGGALSTIVDVTEDAPRLVRAGRVPWERVLESLQQ